LIKSMSFLLVGAGLVFLALQFWLDGALNVTLPLLFLMLAGACFILVFTLTPEYRWGPLLYIPGCVLLAFGLVFLLNVITGDWNAWAYAWLLLLAGAGAGLGLAGRSLLWRKNIILAAVGTVVGGLTLFALFGAIAGGPFIQVMAPILLILGGLTMRWLRLDALLAERLLHRGRAENVMAVPPAAAQPGLVEPVSPRELEVLRLIEQGLSNAEIAAKLTLAPSTVKTHINNIYGKLGVQTRVQALNRARELRLL
jgi:DNA-binding CsgD family transcriptional regulator